MFNIFDVKIPKSTNRHKRSMSDPLTEIDQPNKNFFDYFVATNIFNQPLSPGNISNRIGISTATKNVEH